MAFIPNLFFIVFITLFLAVNMLMPFLNLHIANSSLAHIKTEVNQIINENRNNPSQIKSNLQQTLSELDTFELVSVQDSDANDFKVIELEFKYKLLFNGFNKKVKNQKMRFIVSNV
jgi:hypothetical protein